MILHSSFLMDVARAFGVRCSTACCSGLIRLDTYKKRAPNSHFSIPGLYLVLTSFDLQSDMRGTFVQVNKGRKSNVGIDGVTAIGLVLWFVEVCIFPGDHNLSKRE